MHIGILQFELLIRGATSIKDKRRVVKSVKDRLHREHMVSVAEVGLLDSMGAARLGLAAVSADPRYLASVLDRIVGKLRNLHDAELGDLSREIMHGDQLAGEFTDEEGRPLWTPEESREGEGDVALEDPASSDLTSSKSPPSAPSVARGRSAADDPEIPEHSAPRPLPSPENPGR